MSSQLRLGDWGPELRPGLSQYPTPRILARRVVDWAGVRPGDSVLEPSAGGGNLVRELMRVGARVTAVEVDPEWAHVLVQEAGVKVVCADFIQWEPAIEGMFDLAVMNPPLNGGVGGDHVAHALRFAPRVVSVLRLADLAGRGRFNSLWSKCRIARLAILVERPVFAHVDGSDGGLTDFCVVDVRADGSEWPECVAQTVEHWRDRWR